MDDHSIVAGLGCPWVLEEDEGPLLLTQPQATSTQAAKMTREQANRQYLQNLQEGSEGSSEEFQSSHHILRGSNHYPYSGMGENCGSSGLSVMTALALIDTEALSGLSSSNFLVDHTQSPVEAGQDQQLKELQGGTQSQGSTPQNLDALCREELNPNTSCEEEKHLDLSQGEVRELLPYDPSETEACEKLAGLPSALLEPQMLPLDPDQLDLEGGVTKDLTAFTAHLSQAELQHDEFSTSQVQFDASQISACSTIHEDNLRALEASKLLSNSCNSLGSIDGPSDPFLTHQQKVGAGDEDWLEAHQGELAHLMEGEQFGAADLMFFEEEEKKHHEENRFCIDMAPASSRHSLDVSCFSGIHGVTEITVRPSWIGSPEKQLLGPDNHMLVDDYLQARSEALGTLGVNKNPSDRPNFGQELHSPPTSTRTQPLTDQSAGDDSSYLDDTESGMKQDSFTSSVSASGLNKGCREDTSMSQGTRASSTITLMKAQKEEETSGMEVVHEVERLEASVHSVGQPLVASTITSLLTRALATNAPHNLVDRILRLTQQPPVSSLSLETTGLDASLEVMELRQMKEDIVREKQRAQFKSYHPPGKENRGKEEMSKHACIPNRKPLISVDQPGQCPAPALSHKHMKLKAVRTSSDPGIPSQTCRDKSESDLEETLQGAQYMSKLVDDTGKLIMPSFHQGEMSVKSSTPCFPRTQIPVPDSSCGEPVTTTTTTTTRQALPRMGLLSSSKGLVRTPQLGLLASEAKSDPGLRTTASCPTSVSTPPTTATTNTHGRPQHHQDGTSQSCTNSIGLSVPQHVMYPEACVVGMATYTTLTLHNTSLRWLQVSLRLRKETLDGSVSTASVLLFQPSHFIEPQERCDVRLGVCCPVPGHLEALLEVQVGELTPSERHHSFLATHTVVVSATITVPKVEVQFEGGLDCVDFGVVGESCCLSHCVTLINCCPKPLPLLLHLHQVAGRGPIFCWEEDKNKTGRVVSATHLSCELPPATPTDFYLTLRAPFLDGGSVTQNGRIDVGSLLSVLLDTPAPTPPTLASHPIKAAIGVVQLQILRTNEPLVVNANQHQSGSTHLTLKNASSFPLHITLTLSDDAKAFSLRPSSLTIPPGAHSSLALLFSPGAHVGTLDSVLMLRVEPDGMKFKMAVSGVCHPSAGAPSSSVSPSTPATSVAAHTAAPPRPPVTVPAPASAKAPAHKQLLKIHASLTKSSSAPLSEVTSLSTHLDEKSLSSALESTKSHLMFGAVALGDTSCQKLVLRNNLTTQKLPLCLNIIGSPAFQMCASGSEKGKEKLDVVLKPREELLLSVFLQPSSVEPLSATLVCRHCSSSNPYKWKIPLLGYGGRGKLAIKGNGAGKPFILRGLSLGLPAILQASLTNTAHRTLFLVLQMFSDKECKEAATDLSVQPTRLVLGAGETQEVYVMASGSAQQMARTPGLIGALQAISVEDILRQRYQRMKNKEVKVRRINNPGLLKVNWMEELTTVHKSQQEPDSLPPQSDDAVVFFNACTITQVDVLGEQRPNEDHSTTAFACLAGEKTVMNLTSTQVESVGGSFGSSSAQEISNLAQPSSVASWDVLPQAVNVRCGDASPQVFFIVNFSNTQQMLEITSSCSWLEIEPREAVLPGHSSVKLCVSACPPHTLTTSQTHSLKVMGENESHSATVTILPAIKEAPETQIKSSKPLPNPVAAREAPRNTHNTQANILPPVTSTHHHKASSQLCSFDNSSQPQPSTQPPRLYPATNHCHTQASPAAQPTGSTKSHSVWESRTPLVQLESEDVSFPDTRVNQETYVRVVLRNLDETVYSVHAEVTGGPFMVRHTQFTIKPDHYVSVPVYFRPQDVGLSTGSLQLVILKDELVLSVHLSGNALP